VGIRLRKPRRDSQFWASSLLSLSRLGFSSVFLFFQRDNETETDFYETEIWVVVARTFSPSLIIIIIFSFKINEICIKSIKLLLKIIFLFYKTISQLNFDPLLLLLLF
jgi:hypothetical protein